MASRHLSLFFLFVAFVLLALSGSASGRLIARDSLLDPGSDGLDAKSRLLPLIRLNASESCEQTYGFMPCTTNVLGNLSLITVHGLLMCTLRPNIMYLAATFLSRGSELLLQILGSSIIRGLFLPMLGSLPGATLILVSGLSGSTETARSRVSDGVGLLAGSTVMLLTVIWGTCIVIGKCDLRDSDSVAIDGKDTKGFNLIGSGVSTDIWTSYAARIMVVSVVPFLVVQLPQIMNSTSGRHLAVLIALIISLSLLASYCLYQVFQPSIQRRRLAFAKHKHLMSGILIQLTEQGRLLNCDGNPDSETTKGLFERIAGNGDGTISLHELRGLIAGISFEDLNFDQNDAADRMMRDFDKKNDNEIDCNEFVDGISRWLLEAKRNGPSSDAGPDTYLDRYHQVCSLLLLLLGTFIAAVFADPLVDAIDNLSDAAGIPSFFISFIVLPLATNSSEAVSAIISSSQKKQRSASLTFSELYGAVTMNNVLCLSVFLALAYVRGLTWDCSSEVLITLVVCILMGAFASFRTTFPLWTSLVAFLLYPLSLLLVYLLDYIFGWP
ncbi:hypothetical protein NMG60_11037011 [Bertholletia excelsa]